MEFFFSFSFCCEPSSWFIDCIRLYFVVFLLLFCFFFTWKFFFDSQEFCLFNLFIHTIDSIAFFICAFLFLFSFFTFCSFVCLFHFLCLVLFPFTRRTRLLFSIEYEVVRKFTNFFSSFYFELSAYCNFIRHLRAQTIYFIKCVRATVPNR